MADPTPASTLGARVLRRQGTNVVPAPHAQPAPPPPFRSDERHAQKEHAPPECVERRIQKETPGNHANRQHQRRGRADGIRAPKPRHNDGAFGAPDKRRLARVLNCERRIQRGPRPAVGPHVDRLDRVRQPRSRERRPPVPLSFPGIHKLPRPPCNSQRRSVRALDLEVPYNAQFVRNRPSNRSVVGLLTYPDQVGPVRHTVGSAERGVSILLEHVLRRGVEPCGSDGRHHPQYRAKREHQNLARSGGGTHEGVYRGVIQGCFLRGLSQGSDGVKDATSAPG